jgi:outer membrane protein assembly factor BamB
MRMRIRINWCRCLQTLRGYPACAMRFARANRRRWALAGVVAIVAGAAGAYAIVELSEPSQTAPSLPPTTPTATTAPLPAPPQPPTTTVTTPTKHRVNNFTVPFYGNNQGRDRRFTAIRSLNPPFKLAWRFGGNALLEFPATIWGSNLYLMDDGATVKRVNITTGKQIWARHVGKLSASTPSLDVAHKELFVSILSRCGSTIGSVNGDLAALSMRSGKTLWKFPVPSGTESSPMVVGHSVYFGDQAGTEYSLNIRTGHENWSLSTGGSIKAGAAYYHGNLYFGNYAGSFYAVNAKSGKVTWSASPGGEFYSTPAVADGRVYAGNNDDDMYSFVASNGVVAWTTSLGGYVYSGPAVADTPGLGPTVYIGSYDGDLYALNTANGSVRWAANVGGAISGSATVVNNTVYVSTVYEKGSYGFNARTGQRVFYFPDGSYTTVVADRTALFLMGKYTLYKFVPHNERLPKRKKKHRRTRRSHRRKRR